MHTNSVFLKTKNNNTYLYKKEDRSIYLSHPLLKSIHESKIEGKELDISSYSSEDVEYYKEKYDYWEKKGFFNSIPPNVSCSYSVLDVLHNGLNSCPQIVFEMTESCNLNCKYCIYGEFYDLFKERGHRNMDFDTAKSVIDYFAHIWDSSESPSMNTENYISFYGGEPLLNFQVLKEIVNYVNSIEKKNYTIKFGMTTNGVLLDECMDFLVENDFALTISLDGDQKANQYRVFNNGNESFTTVFNNIKKLQKKYPEYFIRGVALESVYTDKSCVKRISEFLKKEFDKIPRIVELNSSQTPGNEKGNEISNSIFKTMSQLEDRKKIENELTSSLNYIRSFTTFDSTYLTSNYKNFEGLLDNSERRRIMGTCKPCGKKIYVTVDKKMHICEKIGNDNPIGEIQNGELVFPLDDTYQKYKDLYAKAFKICQTCSNVDTCMYCIFDAFTIKDLKLDDKIYCKYLSNDNHFNKGFCRNVAKIEDNKELYVQLSKGVTS